MDKCKDYVWSVNKCNKQNYECFYAVTNTKSKSSLLLHRFVTNATKDIYIDHINRDSLDNRKSNLRPCDDSTNSMNSKLYSNNKSGHKGVRWDTVQNKWMAYMKIKQHHKTFGYFKTFEEAVEVREAMEKKYFGEYNAKL